jgi:uncharacterized heparinase superfamily protein
MLRQLGELYRCTRHVPLQQLVRRMELNARRRWMATVGRYFDLRLKGEFGLAEMMPKSLFRPREHLVRRTESGPLLSQLGSELSLTPPVNWLCQNRPGTRHLDRLALHYHEFLECLSLEEGWNVLEDWIAANPPYRHGYWLDAWNSYAVSIRCVCWLQWLERYRDRLTSQQLEKVCRSLVEQLTFLRSNLETDICGNHLIKNIRCLLWASVSIDCPQSATWGALGRRLLRRELVRQILPDGMHYELSPAYHCQVLGDLLECASVLHGDEQVELLTSIEPMMDAMRLLTHPDGLISLFSDGGLHMVYSPSEIEEVWGNPLSVDRCRLMENSQGTVGDNCSTLGEKRREESSEQGVQGNPLSVDRCRLMENNRGTVGDNCSTLGEKRREESREHGVQGNPLSADRCRLMENSRGTVGDNCSTLNQQPSTSSLASSGYYHWRSDRQWLLMDCGAVCEDTLPAHGHADMLSFEWDVDGERIIVDPGVYEYEAGVRRALDRSVASHNTVQVGELDQAEMIGSFRIGRRSRANCESFHGHEGTLEWIASHDAFAMASVPIRHRRSIVADASHLSIVDQLIAIDAVSSREVSKQDVERATKSSLVGTARFLFHDACQLEQQADGSILIVRGMTRIVMVSDAPLRIVPAEWSPDFGDRIATRRVEATFSTVPGAASFHFFLEN